MHAHSCAFKPKRVYAHGCPFKPQLVPRECVCQCQCPPDSGCGLPLVPAVCTGSARWQVCAHALPAHTVQGQCGRPTGPSRQMCPTRFLSYFSSDVLAIAKTKNSASTSGGEFAPTCTVWPVLCWAAVCMSCSAPSHPVDVGSVHRWNPACLRGASGFRWEFPMIRYGMFARLAYWAPPQPSHDPGAQERACPRGHVHAPPRRALPVRVCHGRALVHRAYARLILRLRGRSGPTPTLRIRLQAESCLLKRPCPALRPPSRACRPSCPRGCPGGPPLDVLHVTP